MNKIVFTTDSPADMPKSLQKDLGVGVIPLHVNLDGVDYKDGENITNEIIYNTFQEKKVLPNTSAVSVGEYTEFFKHYLEEGKTIIHVAFSSGISSTYQNACIAAEDLEAVNRIYIIDSQSLSQAICILIYKGIALQEQGKSAPEIVDALEAMIPKLDKTFVVTSLTFLAHGGRCSAVTAFGANLLKLKPLIDMVDGKMEVAKKYRGSDLKVYLEYIDDRLKDVDYDDEFVCISSALVDKDTLHTVEKHLKKNYHFKNIILNDVGCVVTAHGGKGAFALFFLKK